MVYGDLEPNVPAHDDREQGWSFQDVVITDEAGALALLQEAVWTQQHEQPRNRAWASIFDDTDTAIAFTRACAAERNRRSSPADGQHLIHKFVGFSDTADPVEQVRQAVTDPTKRVIRLGFLFREAEEFWFTDRARRRQQGIGV